MEPLTARYYNQLPQSNGGMMAQHTPGPWKITGPNIRSEDGGLLFVQGDQFMDDDPDPVEQAANRRLVAAAPDLLAACHACVAVLFPLLGETGPSAEAWAKARAAILKTGPSGLEG